MMDKYQSVYSVSLSTETALNCVLNNIKTVDSRDIAMLVLLDLSAAFDTIDYARLSCRFEK